MNIENILEACKWIALVAFGGLALYFKYNTALKDRVTGAINEAEEAYKDQTQAGKKKFNFVVDTIYGWLPAILRPIFTRSIVEQIVQATFDQMQAYAVKQLDRLTGNDKPQE